MSEDQTKQTPKNEMGLYCKFIVKRTDGSSEPGGKHYGCDYFTLDLTHDPYAIPTLKAYADACENEYPNLARDLRRKIEEWGARWDDHQRDALQAKLDRLTELVEEWRKAVEEGIGPTDRIIGIDTCRGELEQALKGEEA